MSAEEAKDFTHFLGRLVHQLIFNILNQGMIVRRYEEMEGDIEKVSNWNSIDEQHFSATNFVTYFVLLLKSGENDVHAPKRISKIEKYKNSKAQVRLPCRVCKQKTTYYCPSCVSLKNSIVSLCSASSERNCWVQHHKNV